MVSKKFCLDRWLAQSSISTGTKCFHTRTLLWKLPCYPRALLPLPTSYTNRWRQLYTCSLFWLLPVWMARRSLFPTSGMALVVGSDDAISLHVLSVDPSTSIDHTRNSGLWRPSASLASKGRFVKPSELWHSLRSVDRLLWNVLPFVLPTSCHSKRVNHLHA